MMRRRHRTVIAMTLIEVIVTLGIISFVLGVGGVLFAEVIRLKTAQDRYFRRLNASDHLLQWIARDVRSARAFAVSAEEFEADETTLILVTDQGKVVYRVGEGRVARYEMVPDHRQCTEVFDAPDVTVRFDFEGRRPEAARSVVATAEWHEPAKVGVVNPVLSLRVALRRR